MERIAWIGGNQRRHLYYINELSKEFDIVGGVMQERTDAFPTPPDDLCYQDRFNWLRHFLDREWAEKKFYGEQKEPTFDLMKVDEDTLNEPETAIFIKNLKPDVVIIYGTGMIREPLLSALPARTVNLHLGLSPRYRGAATLFWPFYFLEPNWAGSTFHYIVHTPDGGDIIHQVVPKMEKEDGIHDVACRVVIESAKEMAKLLKMDEWVTFSQKPEAGKNFLQSDFKPQHLRMIYNEYDNDIAKAYLEGKLICKEPNLKRQYV